VPDKKELILSPTAFPDIKFLIGYFPCIHLNEVHTAEITFTHITLFQSMENILIKLGVKYTHFSHGDDSFLRIH
jgi:hypothetical protein